MTAVALIVSDIHHAGPAERERVGYELACAPNWPVRQLVRAYRGLVWLREPLGNGLFLEEFLRRSGSPDLVIANGDYSADSRFIGVSDHAAFASADECLGKLRARFGEKLHATIGDHELGKTSLVGGHGGLRLASWPRTTEGLGLRPFWRHEWGSYVFVGVTSTLLALPIYEREMLSAEREQWETLRAAHVEEVRAAFARLSPHQRVLLFCHDPTALPFLARLREVTDRLAQIEATVIGHLHSPLILRTGRVLSGMPAIPFLGVSVRRMSTALNEAKLWRPFNVRLCPSLTGIQLLKDGGWLTVELDSDARHPAKFRFHPLPWHEVKRRAA
ncbi:MAG: Uncharacterized protein FD161_968 [Limisphaerales bacterium]|nr:MAG: Uncharacterized protein FD161_968 [Limisphaerales bacterium]KAG0509751.1 MAG: Uncharacterized protein E1N63_968 [Limisphaerales bacterium]TXT51028.1 MAG: Uncharacterized protein FD140_2090 [Limisphaerales bacterium]